MKAFALSAKVTEMDAISAPTQGLSNAQKKMLWPTPTSSKGGTWRSDGQIQAIAQKAKDYEEFIALTNGSCMSKRNRYWPTPTTVSCNQVGRLDELGGSRSRENMRGMVTKEELTGQLNPSWVEWLMGFPIGFTALKDSATPKSRCKPPQHGNS
jgi:hypothetical protein